MTRVSAMLLMAVVLSALYLVRTQYESRRLYTELDRAKALAQRLDTEHDRLDVERGAQATPLRVEKLAREQMHMQTISPAITQYVSTHVDSSENVSASTTPKAQP
ncbi:MAG: cell division protein FtsL [Betaproteobacteria bacterium]|jgi:cell division protein FtsL|nr:cell division protein FtsL [Betaproteobacteria bacterium]